MSNRGHNAANGPGQVGWQPVVKNPPVTDTLTETPAPSLGVNADFIKRLTERFPDAATVNVSAFIDENTDAIEMDVTVFDDDGLQLSPQPEYDYTTGHWDTTGNDEYNEWVNDTLFHESDREAFLAEHMIRSEYVDGVGYYIDLENVPLGDIEDRPACNGMCLNGRDMGDDEHTNMVYPDPDCPKHTYGDRLDAYDPQFVGYLKNNSPMYGEVFDVSDNDIPPF